jgi:thiol-disulfide isomerase/thioredoxin
MKKSLFTLAAALLAATSLAVAGELGQAAAPLKITEWVKGKPVDLAALKGKQIVVVEFWATWCGPCRTSIPHLTEMQHQFKDVVFIGVTDEESATVKKFVEKMGEKMDYTVARDEDGKTSAGYMEAFGIRGIPHAFIVDKESRIVWHGHPMAGLDKAIEEVLAGKLDIAKAKQRDAARQKLEAFFEAVSKGESEAKLDAMGKELEALDAEIGGIEPGQKFNAADVRKTVKFRSLLRDYQLAVQSGKGGTNLARIEQLLDENAPQDFKLAEFKESIQLNKTFSDYYRAVASRAEPEQVAELAAKLAAVKTTNPRVLNEWAWTILTDERIKTRDIELATKLAKMAVDACEGKDAAVLDTYARAMLDSGKLAEAVAWQKKAVAAAEDEDSKKELGATLKKYEAKAAAK